MSKLEFYFLYIINSLKNTYSEEIIVSIGETEKLDRRLRKIRNLNCSKYKIVAILTLLC